jgi:hypothetical protein
MNVQDTTGSVIFVKRKMKERQVRETSADIRSTRETFRGMGRSVTKCGAETGWDQIHDWEDK